LPITEFCDQNRLTTNERLELFVSVCQAVQHAHQKGIIHRDIKPSNVLVTLHDGTPVPKIIDFGIAKALGRKLTDKTMYTGFAQLVGTPLYMSPEQAELSGLDIDTRTDIYSLGVLLYELLTGTTPFDKERLKDVGYDELRRIIREEEPPKPSTRISTLGQASTTISTQRKSDPKRLSQLFRGELDWIVMKALEKDRNRRFETASALAADVQHYLHDEPVQACPPSAWYRFRKFARRKKMALAMAACVFLALGGIAGSVGWAVRDRVARDHDQAVREEALDKEVERLLEEAGPLIELEKWPEALAVVERADKLLASAGRTERPPRLLDLQKDLIMAQRLEAIYREPIRELKAVAIVSGGEGTERTSPAAQHSSEEEFFWGRQQDARFAAAFREFGIDLDALDPGEAAARIGRASIQLALVRALDEWAAMRKRARGDEDGFWRKLVEIARQADPDEWRNRFREALLRPGRPAREELEKLADAVPIREVPPATVYLLGHALNDLGAVDKAMALLREAHRDHPDDFWINDALGYFSRDSCRPPRYDDALRYYSMTVALRPRSWHTHSAVAQLLAKKGAKDEAIEQYSKAIELDPGNARPWSDRGRAYSDLHKYEDAIADYTRAIELDPKKHPPFCNRGNAYGNLHQYDKALADLNNAIDLDPKCPGAWDTRGCVWARLHQYDKSIADFNKSIVLDPKRVSAWYNRGATYLELDQYDKAIADCSKAMALDPKNPWAWNNRGAAYNGLHQYDKALADLNEAIELDPKFAPAWTGRGLAYKGLSQYDKAIADYSKAIELDPKYVKAWNNRGLAYRGHHQYDKALADYSKAIELDPKDPVPWNNRGYAYNQLHQYAKAMADLNKAIELDQKDAVYWNNRGNAYLGLHQFDKAIADYSKVIELDPKDAGAWLSRGGAYGNLHQYDKAIADMNKTIELDPNYAMAWNNRGAAYNGLHQYDKALADLNKAIELDPKLAGAWSNRGNAYRGLHQHEKAIADYSKVIELDPKDAGAWLSRGGAYGNLHQYDKAIADCSKAIDLDPKDPEAHVTLGAILCDQKHDYDGAIACFRRAIELDPKSVAAHSNLGVALCGKGKLDEAIQEHRRAIELDPTLAGAHRNLAVALHANRQLDQAIAEYRKAAELDPKMYRSSVAAVLNNLAWGLATNPEARLRDPVRAVELAQTAVDLSPKHAMYRNTLGVAHYRAGHWKEAISALTKSMELQKGALESFDTFFLAMAHWRLGDKDVARQSYDRAVEWMDKNRPKDQELRRFRAEAEGVLEIKRN
jgi:tetratricopeptide (TPR) repeat protein